MIPNNFVKKLKQFKNRRTRTERRKLQIALLNGSSSEKERKVNALASGAEEGRDKLR